MPLGEAVTTIVGIAAIALILITILRLFGTLITHNTIRKAVSSNPEQAAEVLSRLATQKTDEDEGRLPIVLIAIALAMILAPVIAVDDPGLIRACIAAAIFPLFVGGALWLRTRAIRRASRHDVEQ